MRAKPYLKLLHRRMDSENLSQGTGWQPANPWTSLSSFTKIYFNTRWSPRSAPPGPPDPSGPPDPPGPSDPPRQVLSGKFWWEWACVGGESALNQIDQRRFRRSPSREPAPTPDGCRQSWDLKMLAFNDCITCLRAQQSRNYGRTWGNSFFHWLADFRNSGKAIYGSF